MYFRSTRMMMGSLLYLLFFQSVHRDKLQRNQLHRILDYDRLCARPCTPDSSPDLRTPEIDLDTHRRDAYSSLPLDKRRMPRFPNRRLSRSHPDKADTLKMQLIVTSSFSLLFLFEDDATHKRRDKRTVEYTIYCIVKSRVNIKKEAWSSSAKFLRRQSENLQKRLIKLLSR